MRTNLNHTKSPLTRLKRIGRATVIATASVAVALSLTASAADAGRDKRRADASIRVIDFNSDFTLSHSKWTEQLNQVAKSNPAVILLQETQWRDKVIEKWADRNGYGLLWPKGDEKQESTVMWKKNRFNYLGSNYRLGSKRLIRADGRTINARYIATAYLRDTATGRKMAFSSTHTVPEVMWWPDQAKEDGAPNPFSVQPRTGSDTLSAFYGHVRAVRRQVDADFNNGYIAVLGGDFNSGFEYESAYRGFQTATFGTSLVSNHTVLGPVATYAHQGLSRTIDYVYISRTSAIQFTSHGSVDMPSDHHMVITNLRVTKK